MVEMSGKLFQERGINNEQFEVVSSGCCFGSMNSTMGTAIWLLGEVLIPPHKYICGNLKFGIHTFS